VRDGQETTFPQPCATEDWRRIRFNILEFVYFSTPLAGRYWLIYHGNLVA
jgi:hypothetical protein